MKNITKIIESS
jgi:hypothetical protein